MMVATKKKFLPFEKDEKMYRADLYIYPSGNIVVNIRGEFDREPLWPNGTPVHKPGRLTSFQIINGLPSATTKPEPHDQSWEEFYDACKDVIADSMEWF